MRLFLCTSGWLLFFLPTSTIVAQSLKKQEARAINRSRHTVVDGDTVQLFTVAPDKNIHPRRNRIYYWYTSEQVYHAQGEINGRVLHGPYRLTTRTQQPLVKGSFHYGTKTGRWRTWHANGQVASVSRWHHGHPQGRPVYYETDGTRRPKPTKARRPRAVAEQPKRRRLLRRRAKSVSSSPSLPPAGMAPAERPTVADSPARKTHRAERKQQRALQKEDQKAKKQQRPARTPTTT